MAGITGKALAQLHSLEFPLKVKSNLSKRKVEIILSRIRVKREERARESNLQERERERER